MRIFEIFQGTLDLLSDETKWTKEAYARDASGNRIDRYSPDATCWCLHGALDRIATPNGVDKLYSATAFLIKILQEKGFPNSISLSKYNDLPERTFEDIRNLLKTGRDTFLPMGIE